MRHVPSVSLCFAWEKQPLSDTVRLFVYNPLQHFGRVKAELVFIRIIQIPHRRFGEGSVA
jgi:hypothetical protein